MNNAQNPLMTNISVLTPFQGFFNKGTYLNLSSMWILDSGASDHVCPYIKCFSKIKSIKPLHIHLPNRNIILANFSGTIILDPSLILLDVLYIPEFRFNLISISKLCHNYHYQIPFSRQSCHIQHVSTKKTISLVDQHRNIYILHKDTYTHSAHTFSCNIDSLNIGASSNLEIWHRILGHPSNEVLQHLDTSLTNIKYHKNLLCHAFHLAKQCRQPYPTSNYVTSTYFELLHVSYSNFYPTFYGSICKKQKYMFMFIFI